MSASVLAKYAGLPDINDSDSSENSLVRLGSSTVTRKTRKTGQGKGGAGTGVEDAVDGSTLLPSKDRVRKVFGGRRERTRTKTGEDGEHAYTARPRLPPISQRLAPRSSAQPHAPHSAQSATAGSSSVSSEDSSDNDDDVNYLTARTTASLGIRETPQARLRRLKWEMAQLEKELVAENARALASNAGTGEGMGEGEIDTTSSTNILTPASTTTNGTTRDSSKQPNRRRTKKSKPSTTDLLKQLAGLQKSAGELDQAAALSAASGSITNPTSEVVRMIVKKAREGGVPEQTEEEGEPSGRGMKGDERNGAELGGDVIAAELDRRLHLLEKRIGTGTVDETSISQPIIQQLQKMETIVSLLAQPAYLDTAGRKVKVLLADLGKASALASASSGQNTSTTTRRTAGGQQQQQYGPQQGETGRGLDVATPDELERLDSLYSLIPRLDPLLPILPPLLTRLRSLASLHANASSFAQTLEQLESQTHEIARREGDLGKMLHRVEEGLLKNAGGVERNWASLEGRVGDLVGRLEKLGVGRD
ncbi:hypothetical protein QFC21_004082 [Naganishia friedmannii]|uniref:Uncharacterized protein n=1 Tax=Naganishia friedmannii TaxID=89922 RepID=A0ACC2VIT8_9TREE|nr:hypothetical protein QFC21_004082 [Naganishia friedmannii]